MIERPRGRDGAGSCRRDFDSHDVADAWFRQSLEMLEAIQSHPEVGQSLLAYGRAPRSQRDAGPEQIAKL
jgi:hypothetical protein